MSINRGTDKEDVVYIYNGMLAIKRNKFETVVVRWGNLEPAIGSEVSQKEKNKYCILVCIYMESRKMVLMNLFAGKK